MPSSLNSKYSYLPEKNLWIDEVDEAHFDYSDGDEFENRLMAIVSSAKDKSVESPDIFRGITDWPSKYHLSPQRANVLRPLITKLRGPILEIGAGCGAITRYLAEEKFEVVALEGSKRRAMITAERCRDFPNVTVIAETFQDFQSDRKFDTILLIGVLEYARVFFSKYEERDPVDQMLEHVSKFLSDDGVVVLAIENQLGLKYFAGYAEDHTGKPMYGIEDQYSTSSAVTFGRHELRNKIATAGLRNQEWWFPYPDYKLPIVVISENALADNISADFTSLIKLACETDAQKPVVTTFALSSALDVVSRNRLHGDLANSFVVLASKRDIRSSDTVAYYYKNNLLSTYNKVTEFRLNEKGIKVVRVPLGKGAVERSAFSAHAHLDEEFFHEGELWKDRLNSILLRDDWSIDDVSSWAATWWQAFANKIREDTGNDLGDISGKIHGRFIDAIPRNLIVSREGGFQFIDQEWEVPLNIEVGYVFVRGLLDSLWGVEHCGKPVSHTALQFGKIIIDVGYRLGVWLSLQDVYRYVDLERQFQENIAAAHRQFSVSEISDSINSTLSKELRVRGRIDTVLSLSQTLTIREAKLVELSSALAAKEFEISELNQKLDVAESNQRSLVLDLKSEIDFRNGIETELLSEKDCRCRLEGELVTLSELNQQLQDSASSTEEKHSTEVEELLRECTALKSELAAQDERLGASMEQLSLMNTLFREVANSLKIANLELKRKRSWKSLWRPR